MLCAPEPNVVTHCAWAELKATPLQPEIAVPLSLKITLPVTAVGFPAGFEATVAVKVTDCPTFHEPAAGTAPSVVVVSNRSTSVTVGSFAAMVPGSSVTIGLPTNAPESVPWAETCGVAGGTPDKFGGLLSVTLNLIVIVLPIGRENPEPVPLIGNVPPLTGIGVNDLVAAPLFAFVVRRAWFNSMFLVLRIADCGGGVARPGGGASFEAETTLL